VAVEIPDVLSGVLGHDVPDDGVAVERISRYASDSFIEHFVLYGGGHCFLRLIGEVGRGATTAVAAALLGPLETCPSARSRYLSGC
jgi:hypothetical protein